MQVEYLSYYRSVCGLAMYCTATSNCCLLVFLSRSLAQREQRLLKRRQAAEEALKQQMDLLQKERHLDKEEESVNKLVSQVMDTYEQRQSMLKSPRRSTEKRKGWSSSSGTSSRTASKENGRGAERVYQGAVFGTALSDGHSSQSSHHLCLL